SRIQSCRVVARHLTEKGDLVATQIPVVPLSPSMAIAMPVIATALFYVVIDIGPLEHLREVQCHAVKHDSGLSICVDVFMANPRNGRCAGHQLRDHEKNYHEDKYGDEKFGG